MHFISGFAGASVTEDDFIKAQMGWAVAEKLENKKRREELAQEVDEGVKQYDENKVEEGQISSKEKEKETGESYGDDEEGEEGEERE